MIALRKCDSQPSIPCLPRQALRLGSLRRRSLSPLPQSCEDLTAGVLLMRRASINLCTSLSQVFSFVKQFLKNPEFGCLFLRAGTFDCAKCKIFSVILSEAAAGCAVEESVFPAAKGSAMHCIAGCGSFDFVACRHFAQDDMRFFDRYRRALAVSRRRYKVRLLRVAGNFCCNCLPCVLEWFRKLRIYPGKETVNGQISDCFSRFNGAVD